MTRNIRTGVLGAALSGAALSGAVLIGPAVAEAAPASLDVILTIDPRVSASTRTALIEEATRIWDRAGVQLEVILPSAPTPSTVPTVRIMAIPWPALPARAGGTTLGELIRTESSAVVMLSLDEAERIVAHLPPLPGISADRRLGIILGRAAAHEIGHYLLDVSTHAQHGLMRARFDEREFGDPESRAFELDREERTFVLSLDRFSFRRSGGPFRPAEAGLKPGLYVQMESALACETRLGEAESGPCR